LDNKQVKENKISFACFHQLISIKSAFIRVPLHSSAVKKKKI